MNDRKRIEDLEEGLREMKDRLKNGIKYDEEINAYIVVWTARELAVAQRKADEMMKRLGIKEKEND